MSGSSSSVQKQWDIGQSVFVVGAAVVAMLSAASQDDVQPQAILAMEALGAGLLVHQDRIGEGIDALNGGESRKLTKLNLMVGLHRGGVAREIRKSVSCVAAFILAVACKTCFTDREVGSILYEMMDLRGVLRKIPVSRWQIEQFVGSVSGYGYKIMPSDIFNSVALKVRENLRHSADMTGLFCSSDVLELAKILSNVFEALQDKNVKVITLEGHQTGIWLCSVFIWLFSDEVEVLLYDRRIHGTSSSRVKVLLHKRDDGGWHIRKWYPEKKVLDLIVGGFDEVPTSQHRSLPLSHQPLGSAKTFLAAAYRLDDDATEATGLVAAALVQIVFEHGCFQTRYGHRLLKVPFKVICQDHFILSYHTITKTFGWQGDTGDVNPKIHKIVIAYKNWMVQVEKGRILANGKGNVNTTVAEDMRQLLLQIENQFFEDNGYSMIAENNLDHMGIIDPVVHVAAEALYSSIFEKLPAYRPYRPLATFVLRANARTLWHLLCGRLSNSENGFQNFRTEAITSVLPGSPRVGLLDLAVVSNGLVAYSAQLGQIQSAKRPSSAISVVEGYLRWGRDQSLFDRLYEKDEAAFPSNRSFYESTQKLEVFHNGIYTGVEALSNPDAVDIETLISSDGKNLTLTTYLTSPSLQDAPVAVNWWRGIEAIAYAEHVSGHYMTAAGEECLALSWEEQKLIDKMAWLNVGANPGVTSITRFITTTSTSEAQRFFEAGRLFEKREILIRQSAPLFQCIKVAMDRGDNWAIIA